MLLSWLRLSADAAHGKPCPNSLIRAWISAFGWDYLASISKSGGNEMPDNFPARVAEHSSSAKSA